MGRQPALFSAQAVTPKIYILLPVHNREEITRGFIECLKMQTFQDYQLVLVDDGSTDGTAEMVKEYIPSATVLSGTGDWWWAGSLQQGLNWLKKQRVSEDALVLFINDDVSFAPDYLECAVRIMKDKKNTLMLSRYKSQDSGEISESGVSADLRRLTFNIADSSDQINCLSTRGLFVHWGNVQIIGGFHPKLLPHYLSDYEYSIRAYNKGFKCETSAALIIVPNNETSGYHVIKESSLAVFLKKYFSRKSTGNPVYWSFFILLTTKPTWMIQNLAQIWFGAGKTIFKAFLAGFKLCSRQ